MKLLNLSFPLPADNLACDEALLDFCEAGGGVEILRFWEPQDYFVVVGYANHVTTEVNVRACEQREIPILRRCSGGGTVLQGPGCLNYSLILRSDGPLASISSANRFIMEQNRSAIEAVFYSKPETRNSKLEIAGQTDLVLRSVQANQRPLKFSGNAQRRKKQFLLFHGTFLLDFDLQVITELLPPPSRQPDYREDRSHVDFLANLRLPANAVKNALRGQWSAREVLDFIPKETIASLVRDKYETTEWNFKF